MHGMHDASCVRAECRRREPTSTMPETTTSSSPPSDSSSDGHPRFFVFTSQHRQQQSPPPCFSARLPSTGDVVGSKHLRKICTSTPDKGSCISVSTGSQTPPSRQRLRLRLRLDGSLTARRDGIERRVSQQHLPHRVGRLGEMQRATGKKSTHQYHSHDGAIISSSRFLAWVMFASSRLTSILMHAHFNTCLIMHSFSMDACMHVCRVDGSRNCSNVVVTQRSVVGS